MDLTATLHRIPASSGTSNSGTGGSGGGGGTHYSGYSGYSGGGGSGVGSADTLGSPGQYQYANYNNNNNPYGNNPYGQQQQQQQQPYPPQSNYNTYGQQQSHTGEAPLPPVPNADGGNQTGIWKYLLIPKNPWARLALLWSLFQCIALIALEAIVLVQHIDEYNDLVKVQKAYDPPGIESIVGNDRAITVYLGLFMTAQLFQLYLSFDAIVNSSVMQLIATTIFNLATLGYSIIAYTQSARITSTDYLGDYISTILDINNIARHRSKIAEIVVILFSLVFFAGWTFLAAKLYYIFGWSIFKNLGADVQLRQRLYIYHVYMLLLKLDVFFILGFAWQYLALAVFDTNPVVVYSNIFTIIPASFILLALAYFSVKRESKILMGCLVVGLLGGLIYLGTRLVDIYTTSSAKYASSKSSLTLFIVLTGLLVIATVVVGIMAALNFGKGLQEALEESSRRARQQMHALKDLVGAS
ncbi:hypothetical protein DFJ73DRAFT_803436 [Zopfochytrium polystomum]|nr:hypothetical protein DFJ73DRAFT_803436 [Zopfochytrium polystomum]